MHIAARQMIRSLCVVCAWIALAGCASSRANPDPFEGFNRGVYEFNEGVDRVLLKPATDLYEHVIPEPLREGVGNGFANLGYANVILNDFLQGQWEQGWQDVGRMALNSTLGIGGIFDVATELGLPANRNDFGVTLGRWGVEPGPYLVLPLLGPSSGRDVFGHGTAIVTNPIFWLSPPLTVTLPLGSVRAIDARSRLEGAFRFRDEAAIDPYIFTREAYLQYRRNLIRRDEPEEEDNFDDWDEDLYEEDFDDEARDGETVSQRYGARGSTGVPAGFR